MLLIYVVKKITFCGWHMLKTSVTSFLIQNSIRHNLSLHNRFIRVQNEGTGKSSWWMVNPDAISKPPRKRAGTMDSTIVQRPARASKRPSGGLKHARSSELRASGNELFDPTGTRGSPSMVASEAPPGFDSPRVRAGSGNSSNSGCSPAALGTSLDADIKPSCFTLPPSTWDVLYPPKQETLSESLADIFISDAAAASGAGSMAGNCSGSSPSAQMYASHLGLQPPQSQQQQQQPMFMTNEAYAHGVPVHQPSPQRFVPQSFSPPVGCGVVGGYPVTVASPGAAVGYQMNGSGQAFGCNGGPPTMAAERMPPTVGELLQTQQLSPNSGYMLNTFLTSGGSVVSAPQQQQQGWSGSGETPMVAPSPQQQPVATATGTPLRRPLHVNQRLLMQLLATKPHLARRLQQLLEAKRRQLSAMQQQLQTPPSPQTVPQLSSSFSAGQAPRSTNATMLQQLLTAGGPRPSPLGIQTWLPAAVDPAAATDVGDAFPRDLDLNLLDLQSTSDINCDIEQVISHELAFGDKLDFSFDQLHLDEFDADAFGS